MFKPYDLGTLDDIKVTNVRRDGDQAILFIPHDMKSDASQTVPFEVGHRPHQKIDWQRRFDHMQQHSGQHLISAVAFKQFNLSTTSWSLGSDSSFIEMDAKEIPEKTVITLEELVNEKIRQQIPVSVSYRDPSELTDVRFHIGVPEDQRGGPVRVIEIGEGIDKNSCCGTHVANVAW